MNTVFCIIALFVLMTMTSSQNATRWTLETLEDVISFGFDCMEGDYEDFQSCSFTSVTSAASLPASFPADFRLLPGNNIWYPVSSGSLPLTTVTRQAEAFARRVVILGLRYYCSNDDDDREACCSVYMSRESGGGEIYPLPLSNNSQWGEHSIPLFPSYPTEQVEIHIPQYSNTCHGVFQTMWITVRDEHCITNSDCPPGLNCQESYFSSNKICRCADKLNTVENEGLQTCNPVLGSNCYTSTNHPEYFPCHGQGAFCDSSNSPEPSIGSCSCSANYTVSRVDDIVSCKLSIGHVCAVHADCAQGRGIGCVNNVCSCIDRHLVYRGEDMGCVATEGNLCGILGVENNFNVDVRCDFNLSCVERGHIKRCLNVNQ